MNLLAAALALTAALPAFASAPSGAWPKLPPDIAAEPVVREIETRLPDCDSVMAAQIRLPSKTLSLGLSTKLYQCWQLKLTGRRGLKALEVLERLKALQDALGSESAELRKALLEYSASPKPNAALLGRIVARSRSIGDILSAYRTLAESGERNELIRVSGGGVFSDASTLTPRLRDDDYAMFYDEGRPQCPSPEQK
ncbi:MAG: hypothetical protein HY922_03955 [Elusimicrobia bacterium]|nr:hypothetical protein [Elusimicrobiota bacterium]